MSLPAFFVQNLKAAALCKKDIKLVSVIQLPWLSHILLESSMALFCYGKMEKLYKL